LSSIIFVILVSSSLWSGTEGTIRGAVRNVEGDPMIGAQVYIGDLGVGAVADMDGNYILINVPLGTFDVTASMLSYGTQVVSVDVIMDATQWMNFALDVEAIDAFSRFLVSQQQAALALTANKLADIPKGLHAQLIVMDDLAITWKSDGTLNYDDLRSELSTWFALESDDIDVPAALNANDTNRNDPNRSDQNHNKQNSELASLPHTLIQLNDGFVRFDERTVFEKLNFTLNKNDHWQITGPNGSGKTCLLQMFTGDNSHCYTNDLTMFGIKRGTGESIWDIKKHIGIMSNSLHMQYKVNANVEHVIISGFHDSIGLYTRPTLAERNVAGQWLAVLGLQQKKNTPFQSLSFGDQRLVLIARSMVKHPALLILDEPCNGLDDFNRQKALKLIDILAKAGTSTLLYVNHNPEECIPSIRNTLNMKDYNV